MSERAHARVKVREAIEVRTCWSFQNRRRTWKLFCRNGEVSDAF